MAIVTRGVTFASVNFVQLVSNQPRIVLRCVAGLDSGGRVRGIDTVIPSATGRTARNRVYDGRVIGLVGFVMGTGADLSAQMSDFRDAIEDIRDAFDPTAAPANLVVALEDGTTATIAARTLPEQPMWGDDMLPTYRELAIDLEAVGSDWVIA